MKSNLQSKVEQYLNKSYTLILEKHDEAPQSYYSMRVLELEGCITTGDSVDEVVRDIQDAMSEWIQLTLELGKKVPEPFKSKRYSGKVILRMPSTLHESLIYGAANEGVSLNQYMISMLARAQGFTEGASSVSRKSRRNKQKITSR